MAAQCPITRCRTVLRADGICPRCNPGAPITEAPITELPEAPTIAVNAPHEPWPVENDAAENETETKPRKRR
jgi:hypothetical protein